jgi:adenylyl- and sulfurtransferase ThiI
MTEEEGEYWDDFYTKNTIMPDPAKNRILTGEGPVARMTLSNRIMDSLDSDVIEYVRTQAAASGKTQGQVASAIIRRELAKSA